MNFRGEYEGGGMVVTARRWWSPYDRRAARLAAKVLEYETQQAKRLGLLMTPQRRLHFADTMRDLSHWPDPFYYGPQYQRWTWRDAD